MKTKMKKSYISPEFTEHLADTGQIIALSRDDEKATRDDSLIKGFNDWDNIWGNNNDEKD